MLLVCSMDSKRLGRDRAATRTPFRLNLFWNENDTEIRLCNYWARKNCCLSWNIIGDHSTSCSQIHFERDLPCCLNYSRLQIDFIRMPLLTVYQFWSIKRIIRWNSGFSPLLQSNFSSTWLLFLYWELSRYFPTTILFSLNTCCFKYTK